MTKSQKVTFKALKMTFHGLFLVVTIEYFIIKIGKKYSLIYEGKYYEDKKVIKNPARSSIDFAGINHSIRHRISMQQNTGATRKGWYVALG